MKFIRIKPKIIKMKAGGGTPILKTPNDINNLVKLKNELNNINFFLGEEIAYLIHKPINKNDFIPAASRRFIKSIKFLLSNNNKEYETTFFDEDKKKLVFVYCISFAEISDAINKIKKTINFLEKNLENNIKQTLESLFDDNKLEYWKNKIKKYKENHNLTIFSISSIREILSRVWKNYGKFWIPNKEINFNSENEQTIVFVSSKKKNKAKEILIKNRVQIFYEDDISLDIKGNYIGKLPGFIYSKSINEVKISLKTNHFPFFEKVLYEKFRQKEFHSVDVGVIDGGISSNSIILNDLTSYHSNEEMFNELNPTGTHAEEVTSVLLFAKNINKINDNLPRPQVHLFNVISNDDNIMHIKSKIEKILELYGSKIKIWNFSIVFLNIKNSSAISYLGVFLDKMQKKYDVIFILPTGNIDENSKNKIIDAPSGSCLGLSVSATKSNFLMTSYSKKGYKKYVSPKPDLAVFGGDENDYFPVIANNLLKRTMGTSFATPLVTRKLSFLVSEGLNIREAVALLINYAHYFMYKNNIDSNDYNGHGVLPIDTSELLDFKNNKAIIVMDLILETNYKQSILDIIIPKTKNNMFDFSYFISINSNAILEKNDTFEYVLDSPRIIFGKVYNNNLLNWKADDRKIDKENDMDEGEEALESNLRTYRGKYKNRDTFKKQINRLIKPTFKLKGMEYNIENWGIKITRNSLLPRGRKGRMKIAIAIIIESKSINNFVNKFIIENQSIIKNINNIKIDKNIKVNEEIKFT